MYACHCPYCAFIHPLAQMKKQIISGFLQTFQFHVGVTEDHGYTVYDNLEKKILSIRPKDSHKFGISRSNLISLQKKIRENGVLKLHKKTIEKIISGSIIDRKSTRLNSSH
jgi:hypothetical protein